MFESKYLVPLKLFQDMRENFSDNRLMLTKNSLHLAYSLRNTIYKNNPKNVLNLKRKLKFHFDYN
jgi:hypothetical protein